MNGARDDSGSRRFDLCCSLLKRLVIYPLLATILAGCASANFPADLPAVSSFSTDTVALADSVDRIAQDTGNSCLRRLALDVPIKGISDENRSKYADVCDQLKQASRLFVELNGTTRAYGRLLGQLADNKLVVFAPEITGVKSAVSQIQSSGSPYFESARLNAAESLADVVLRAASDAYRQKEIKRVLDHHDDLVQLATLLQTYIKRAYLPVLDNEEGNIDGMEEILTVKYLESNLEPLRARELREDLKQQKANLADRRKAALAALDALSNMVQTHSQLLQDYGKKDDKLLIRMLNDYGKQILDVGKQIRAAF